MKIKQLLVKNIGKQKRDALFETEIIVNKNLYLAVEISYKHSNLNFLAEEYIRGYKSGSTNIWKKVCYFSGDEKVEIDDFIPIQNGEYAVFSKNENDQVHLKNFKTNPQSLHLPGLVK